MTKLACFKTYDIRGELETELNEDISYRIGRAYAQYLKARHVALGADARLTSNKLKYAVAHGLMDGGADVIDLGLTGTEEIYFAASHLDVDGGIEITASHNPINYNGMKLVSRGARPIGRDSGLLNIQTLAETRSFATVPYRGNLIHSSVLDDYVTHLLSYINIHHIKPMRLVVNAGNGVAGHVIDSIEKRVHGIIPLTFIKIYHEPDGHFPNGIPNPLLPENRAATADAVRKYGADLGVAWDGDFDRCFFFDENGEFIEGYYIVGLLAQTFLRTHPGEKIVHDPRLKWNTIDMVKAANGVPIESRAGHTFIKERMRKEDAIYGGEMSAHHYFRDFSYCDSGMIPWLLVTELMSVRNMRLSQLVGERIAAYPCSGEINYTASDIPGILAYIERVYSAEAHLIDHTDGLSIDLGNWRFNIRASNTEPLVRLNVEARADASLVTQSVLELEKLIKGFSSLQETTER